MSRHLLALLVCLATGCRAQTECFKLREAPLPQSPTPDLLGRNPHVPYDSYVMTNPPVGAEQLRRAFHERCAPLSAHATSWGAQLAEETPTLPRSTQINPRPRKTDDLPPGPGPVLEVVVAREECTAWYWYRPRNYAQPVSGEDVLVKLPLATAGTASCSGTPPW